MLVVKNKSTKINQPVYITSQKAIEKIYTYIYTYAYIYRHAHTHIQATVVIYGNCVLQSCHQHRISEY